MKIRFSKFTILILIICTSCNIFEDEISEEVVIEPVPQKPPKPRPLVPTKDLIQTDCFEPDSTAPILKSDDFFIGSKWNEPHLLVHENLQMLFVSSSIEGDLSQTGIYRLTSTDGILWERNPNTPIVRKNDYDWVGQHVHSPSVIHYKDKFHLFFETNNGDDLFYTYIGHATSNDGLNWEIAESPIVSPTRNFLDFHGLKVSKPGAAVRGNEILLYFAGTGFHSEIEDQDLLKGSFIESIGLITSDDGESWTDPANILLPDQILYPRSENGDNLFFGFSAPQPLVLNNEVFLFFEVINEDPTIRAAGLTFAYSPNGKDDFEQQEEYIFETNDFWWSQSEIRSPSVYKNGRDIHLWYAGHQTRGLTTTLGVGSATCRLRQ